MQTLAELTVEELKTLIHETVEESIEDYIEDLIAAASSGYIQSIQEARQDYKAGRVKIFENVFNV
ncbi:hypothetical protein JXI42_13305 [bacterium]|nr:hypothetical protein [bacterium]